MSSCINVPPSDRQNASVDNIDESPHEADENQNNCGDEDEDEEEDVDFNPFLKGTPSPEASSSLSSEVHCLDGNSSKPTTGEEQNYAVGDSEHGEEVVMPTAFTPDTEKQLLQRPVHRKSKKRKSDFISVPEIQSVPHKENNSFIMPAMSLDDEDAIWKRTRARYSLASFTLDELETFLQETDDEDDLQNVDDEQEYRKFLAAVLQGGDGDGHSTQDNDNVDDEDEDNDADFEIELGELLESDVDDSKRDKDRKVEYERGGRRPETRQNKRQKASAQYKKKLLEQTKRPLRPLLPILPNGSFASFPTADGKTLTPETAPSYLSSAAEEGLINGFTPQQIGQLHCLIHEHVQLLIQVFSLSILDPSRQHVASQVQGLIFEMLHKRDEVKACRGVSYPCICFCPPNMCPSVTDEIPNFNPAQCTESSSTPNMQILVSQNISTTRERNGQISSSQTAGSFWVPFMSGPIISILDVAPLNLVGRYIDDVFNAVREYRQRHLDSSCDTWNEREPLFHLPHFPSLTEANGEVSKGNMPPAVSTVSTTPGQQPPKKTLAASIVENAKKQSVALVPKDISILAQRFFPLLNPALFPHKPPPAAVANRVLFTDSEDELLALGMIEYNTDWKAIQQRFLPCKTKHQIFVRQKNRCSSKAPENPIKAVRRMKTSPLNAEEIECIQEGLRIFKHDWMSVWRFIVPHRDPSLLPRQWRIALGTQKSYKSDAAKKEKRRVYESNRRRCKTADLANWQQVPDKEDNQVDSTGGENNSGDDYVDNVNEAYVHQAFLADWRPDASCLTSSEHSSLHLREKNLPTGALLREGTHVREQSQIDNIHRFPYARHFQYPHTVSHFTHPRHYPSNSMQLKHQVSDTTLNATKSQIYVWPYRTRRTDGAHLVKLAPDLPPVNLPPTVRVISQAAFKSNQFRAPIKVPASGGNSGAGRERENLVPQLPHVANLRATSLAKAKKDESNQVTENVTNTCPEELTTSRPEESAVLHDTGAAEERGNDSDLQMHPLLFHAPEDGRLSYYPPNCSTSTSSSFAFFSANQPQLNLSLFHSPNQANQVADCFNKSSKTKEPMSTSFGIDFHPLLQITDEENSDFAAACSSTHQFVCLGGKSAQFQNPLNAVQTKSPVNSGPSATSPKPSGRNEKANELDLEIHLSSTSTKEKTKGNRDVGSNNQAKSTISAPNSGNTVEKHKSNSPCHQHSENCSAVQSNLVSSADALAVPSNSDRRCNMDDLGDQSHPEIVMEQEELSDSEEETEEHVEFEREEMADSDGEEGLDGEPIAEVQDKESPSFVTEKVATDADCVDKQCEWKSTVPPQCNTSIPGKGSPILKLSLTSMGKDGSGSSWLTLDSCAPVDPPSTNAKYEECRIGVCPVTKNLASGRPNRSCKKTTPSRKSIATEKDVMDMAQQLSLGPLAVSTLKKPRKRACRTNTGLSTGMTTENSRCDQDKFG